MASVYIRHASLRRMVGLGTCVETSHPSDLVGTDPLGRTRHALRTEVRTVGNHTGQHRGDVLWHIPCPHMGEQVGKPGPFMHFPQQVRNFDERIYLADFGIEGVGRGR